MSKAKMNPVIKDDIQRYKKNKLAAMLALLGIAFCCIYFAVLYQQVNNANYYYKWPIVVDVIFNLFFMLFVFLFSEQVKNYNRKMFWFQVALGALQIIRIFWLPLAGVSETLYPKLTNALYSGKILSSGAFIAMVVGLAGSGACVLASAIIGLIRAISYEKFNKKLENGEVSIEATLKQLDEEDEKKASAVPATQSVEEVTNA